MKIMQNWTGEETKKIIMWTGDYWQMVGGTALESKSREWKPEKT